MFSIIREEAGANLPVQLAPWTFFKTIEIESGLPSPGLDVEGCLADLSAFGVHITDVHVRITEQALSSDGSQASA